MLHSKVVGGETSSDEWQELESSLDFDRWRLCRCRILHAAPIVAAIKWMVLLNKVVVLSLALGYF